MPRKSPAVGSPFDIFQSQVADLINKNHVFTSTPELESMEVGESAFGDGTESSPSAGSNALYYKPNRDTIVVLSFDGTTFSTRYISDTTLSSKVETLETTNNLIEQLLRMVSLANSHLKIITGADFELGEP